MRHYFLGLAANYSRKERLAHTFAIGLEKDRRELKRYLQERYGGETILAKNGRSALAMALMAYFEPGDAVMVNGFTCYAVFEAIKYAKLKPVFVDIDTKDLNAKFTEYDIKQNDNIKGIIIQNTFGNPVDIESLEKFAKQHGLVIIEDLAHSAGIKYTDGREAGTVGAAAVFSFGKDKSIDTISGGAVVFRHPCYTTKGAPRFLPKKHEPSLRPKASDTLRARFYPLFGAVARGLSYVHLSSCWVNLLLKIHWIEKSADNKLDLERKISKFEAKLALRQFKNLRKTGEVPLRDYYLVMNRNEVLKKLKKAGYYFSGFWYEKPVSPERYYHKVHFPEEECRSAVVVSEHIVNLPNYYSKSELEPARKIIKDYLLEEGK